MPTLAELSTALLRPLLLQPTLQSLLLAEAAHKTAAGQREQRWLPEHVMAHFFGGRAHELAKRAAENAAALGG